MRRAWEDTKREPLTADAVNWTVESVALPAAKHLSVAQFEAQLQGREASFVAPEVENVLMGAMKKLLRARR